MECFTEKSELLPVPMGTMFEVLNNITGLNG
jgi:hypothetical protein